MSVGSGIGPPPRWRCDAPLADATVSRARVDEAGAAPPTVSAPATSAAAKSLLRVGEIVGATIRDGGPGRLGRDGRGLPRARPAHAAARWRSSCCSTRRARSASRARRASSPICATRASCSTSPTGGPRWGALPGDGVARRGRPARAARDAGRSSVADALAVVRGAAEALGVRARARHRPPRRQPAEPLPRRRRTCAQVKVLDFGIARPLRATFGMTMPGVYLGHARLHGARAGARQRGDRRARRRLRASAACSTSASPGRPAFAADNLMALLGKVLFEEAPRLRPRGEFPAAARRARRADALQGADPAAGRCVRRAAAAVAGARGSTSEDDLQAPVPRPRRRRGRSRDVEQRLVCVVMAAARRAPAPFARDGGTLASAGRRVVGGAASPIARFGARVERLADGSLVATLVGAGDATDHAPHAARFALALREMMPDAPIVLATGPRGGHGQGARSARCSTGHRTLLLESCASREGAGARRDRCGSTRSPRGCSICASTSSRTVRARAARRARVARRRALGARDGRRRASGASATCARSRRRSTSASTNRRARVGAGHRCRPGIGKTRAAPRVPPARCAGARRMWRCSSAAATR